MTTILFDLDGTIINSFLGITRCVQYALRFKGIDVENLEDLEEYIGPPLKQTFQKNYDFSDEETIDLIRKYRERFDVTGIFENELYPGVEQTVHHLKERGYPLVLASSKPETACKRILEKNETGGWIEDGTEKDQNSGRQRAHKGMQTGGEDDAAHKNAD